MAAVKPCIVCSEPVLPGRGNLSTRIHPWCKEKKVARPERSTPAYKLTRAVSRHGVTQSLPPKQPPLRDRKLLDLAHEIRECMACGKYVEAGCEPAHSNMARHGKGGAMKASDVFFAALCPACHRELDQGSNLTREERQDLWRQAFDKTLVEIWKRGWIRVVA